MQDLLREDSKKVWDLIREEKGGVVFISGSSNQMPKAVREALAFCATAHGGKTEEEAKAYVNQMEREGKLIEECWS